MFGICKKRPTDKVLKENTNDFKDRVKSGDCDVDESVVVTIKR